MTVKWLALLALTAFLAFAGHAQAKPLKPGLSAASAAADQDFSSKGRYAKKQTDTWARTRKYR
jgi:hypothetical protein